MQDDPFSKLLANVVKDSSILQKDEPVKEAVPVTQKTDSGKIKFDSIIAKANSTNRGVDSIIAALERIPFAGKKQRHCTAFELRQGF